MSDETRLPLAASPASAADGDPLSAFDGARVVVVGCGYSGSAFVRRIAGRATSVVATSRSPRRFPELAALGATPIAYDGAGPSADLAAALAEATHVVASAPPDADGDPLLRHHRGDLVAAPSLVWMGYYSTVGVYGDHGGAWVDETSECRPTAERGVRRIEAETAWLDLAEGDGVPVAVLRLAGIYGPGRNAFVNLADGSAKRVVKAGQKFSRIHVGDIAGATIAAAAALASGVFNICDDEPAPPQDVVAYAATLMGIEPPPEVPFESAELSPMARSFYSESRQVSNAKLRTALGYAMLYPTYREALTALWRDGTWRDEAAA